MKSATQQVLAQLDSRADFRSFLPPLPNFSPKYSMLNRRSKLFLALAVTIAVALLLFSLQQSRVVKPEEIQTALPNVGSANAEKETQHQVLAASRMPQREHPLQANPASKESSATGEEEESEPKTGFIFGSVFDSEGVRVQQAKVLVFTNRKQSKPIATLDLEGSNSEYRVELSTPGKFWLMVDPKSLIGSAIPPLARSRSALPQTPNGQVDLNDLSLFAREYVDLATDAEVRMDLLVGHPARVSGRLLSPDGTPIAGALARIKGLDQIIGSLTEDTPTDVDGVFRFDEVFPGNYRLSFTRSEEWTPPLPVDLLIAAGETRDLGDIRVVLGDRSIVGRVIDQDGRPFPGLRILCYSNAAAAEGLPGYDMGAVLATSTTDEEGRFRLDELPRIGVKLSLTPDYNPNEILGLGSPAFWEPALTYDLRNGDEVVDVGTNTVDESRPYRINCALEFDLSWLARVKNSKDQLTASLIPVDGNSLREGVRRASFRARRLTIDTDSNTAEGLVETPMTALELHFQLKGYQDLVFTLQPEALMTWNQTIHVPGDF